MRGLMEHAIEIQNLRKEYPGFTLKDVSFALPHGAIMGLIGPNGAGKTTIIKLILNIVRKTCGEVRVLGLDNLAHEQEAKSRIGFVLDETPFYGYLKVKGAAAVIARFYKTWDEARFKKLCREFDLPRRKRVNALSRGMKMKLALAVALSHGAELILLDEPTSGLDPKAATEFLEIMTELRMEGKAILMSTHDIFRAKEIGDRVGIMSEGRLVMERTHEELRHEDLNKIYIDYMKSEGPAA